MRNIWKNKKIYLIVVIFIILFIFCYISNIVKLSNAYKTNIEYSNNNVDNLQKKEGVYGYASIFIATNKENISKCFKDRVGIVKGPNILIGTNQKELENGYYDICISVENNKLELYILKLWKDSSSKELYDEYYIKELARCILDICKKEYTETDIQKTEKYLLECYLESKKDKPVFKDIDIDIINISSNINEGILKMNIS